jgi:hypothetical protein
MNTNSKTTRIPGNSRSANAFAELRCHIDAGTIGTHAGRLAIFRATIHAGPEFTRTLQEFGLVPPATGYCEDGTPIFNLQETARRLGIHEDEARSVWEAEWPGRPIHAASSPLIHRAH